MHPVLADRRRLLAYLSAWLLLSVLLGLLLVATRLLSPLEAAATAVPQGLVYAFICLGAFWVTRAAPLEGVAVTRSLLTQLGAALLSALAWVAAGRLWALALERSELLPGIAAEQAALAPLLLATGVLLFLLSSAFYYLLAAFGASQEAGRRALQAEIASREAELRVLRAQIHPHFLFNSLNSINALVGTDPEAARRLCVRLGDFLRRSLTLGTRERIPLGEELDLAETLLAIEGARFGRRLAHVVRADGAARACAVPPLLLQPLVENAVTHGIAQRLEGGAVRLEAERHGDRLWIAIENPRDADAAARGGAGIGLQNVRRRLDALHSEGAEMRVLPGPDSFRVELRLPVDE
jgi:hypothetical protein